jgi:hypothetical protein
MFSSFVVDIETNDGFNFCESCFNVELRWNRKQKIFLVGFENRKWNTTDFLHTVSQYSHLCSEFVVLPAEPRKTKSVSDSNFPKKHERRGGGDSVSGGSEPTSTGEACCTLYRYI